MVNDRGAIPVAAGSGLWLGLDTGGTYTDAVVLENQRVIASAKSLTTHWDLSIGIGGALRAALRQARARSGQAEVALVSVSTTLATNAMVENRFSPVCTLLIGFDAPMVERSGLGNHGGALVCVRGGHGAAGEESAPLDEAAVARAVADHADQVDAFAVAANFSVRNPAHELRARQVIRALTPKSVTCAHELSSKLDAPRRALTAMLNARLTPQIRHLIEALRQVLTEESIQAPLMIVKGDGSLIRAEVALDYPVETILSGPAASVVGAGFLTGMTDCLISDMGGTTTDIAVVIGGRPLINAEGALVGGWRTMVEAVDVRTCGLGGDSEVTFDRQTALRIGPRKAMPLSLLAHHHPALLTALRGLAELERPPDFPAQFALRNPGVEPPGHLPALELGILSTLQSEPRAVSTLVRNGAGLAALQRLADAGLATLAAFTPSDALHVLGRQTDWCGEAAECGAKVLATHERNALAHSAAPSALEFSARTVELVVRETGRALLSAALGADPGIEAREGRWGILGDRLIDDVVAGQRFSGLVAAPLGLTKPLVAIGAPASAYYPEVARRLGAELTIPAHAEVCNAVGAVAGVVSQTVEILVNQPSFNVFRVHDPAGSRDHGESTPAIEDALQVSRRLSLAAALRAGAADPQVDSVVTRKLARSVPGDGYLAEALVRSTAIGRPHAVGIKAGGAEIQ
jgi:N-methylhydantoinase A/oxoprolinase/acetone carboxylase beta subunit